jgi:hypothetical protein
MNEMPQDPFPSLPESVGVMRAMHELHTAAQVAGFPERVATEIVTRILITIIEKSAEEG